MFGSFFKKKSSPDDKRTPGFVVAQLSARLQPFHRGELFEDPLNEELERCKAGSVSGGGTMQSESGEIEYCDVEIEVKDANEDTLRMIIDCLERLGAPKGSKLLIDAEEREVCFGVNEGMGVYLNGTDLPEDVYKECDSNFVYSEFVRLLSGSGRLLSYWQGPTETAYYLYGSSFNEMHERISEFVASYPLCQQCRIEKIA